MALIPKDTYPGQVDTGDAAYPHGKARNITTPGDGTGTPWEEKLVNDHFGFQQALLAQAGITPNDVPDQVGASQYLDAVETVGDQRIAAEFYASGAKRIDGDEWVYPTPKLRTMFIPGPVLAQMLSVATGPSPDNANPWSYDFPPVGIVDSGGVKSRLDSARAVIALNRLFRSNAEVNRIRALVKPGAARSAKSSAFGDGGRMWMGIYTQSLDMSSMSSFLSATPFSGPVEDDGTTDKQVLDTTVGNGGAIDLPMFSDSGHNANGSAFLLVVTGGDDFVSSGSSTHVADLLDGLIINWTDPGPRS